MSAQAKPFVSSQRMGICASPNTSGSEAFFVLRREYHKTEYSAVSRSFTYPMPQRIKHIAQCLHLRR
jgi:hypothetical protein